MSNVDKVVKEKILGMSSGAEFQKQSKHGETQMLALATLKLHHTSFSTPFIKRFQIDSLNSMTDLLKRPSATIRCS